MLLPLLSAGLRVQGGKLGRGKAVVARSDGGRVLLMPCAACPIQQAHRSGRGDNTRRPAHLKGVCRARSLYCRVPSGRAMSPGRRQPPL